MKFEPCPNDFLVVDAGEEELRLNPAEIARVDLRGDRLKVIYKDGRQFVTSFPFFLSLDAASDVEIIE